ncbi:hypothetical protein FCV66_04825 [Enterovibrio norvegicus]|uniref:hypothetical protein n=1 Tax=Enterovibrio norvegicus TaxID=188144 RepID=UPI000C848EFB|nr:hypothetical protein [Enterovibrio norvegicus]PMI31769.1 hypothetical protein BCU47_14425 [Enterovibrio norvegicus]TKF17524.1 hypothetical protein FCV66_04825 [Enterovibrio norvegicus]
MSRLFGQYLSRNLQGQQTLKPMIPSYYSGISAGMPSRQSITGTQAPSQGNSGQSEGREGNAFSSSASSSSLLSNAHHASNVVAISPSGSTLFHDAMDSVSASPATVRDIENDDESSVTQNSLTQKKGTNSDATEGYADSATHPTPVSPMSEAQSLSQHGSSLAHSSSSNMSSLHSRSPISQGSDGKAITSAVQHTHHDQRRGERGNEDADVASANTPSHQTSPSRGNYTQDVAASILSPTSPPALTSTMNAASQPSVTSVQASHSTLTADASIASLSERAQQMEQAKQFAAKRRHAETNVSVNVTIGQVTVTTSALPQSSTHSTQQQVAYERPAWKPSLTLSDYLRQREDGER